MSLRKAIGSRGSWFAKIDGVSYPCVHDFWYKGGWYDDPHVKLGADQWDELIEAIKRDRTVILTRDKTTTNGMEFERTGYIGLFEVGEVLVEEPHLKFRMIRRIESLK